ncbi:hypothetical protein llg_15730 [Luteolibacter sp. LG18]|nr:hypothetical protein llg_15730 [Luteolibacter sp. LG18]
MDGLEFRWVGRLGVETTAPAGSQGTGRARIEGTAMDVALTWRDQIGRRHGDDNDENQPK